LGTRLINNKIDIYLFSSLLVFILACQTDETTKSTNPQNERRDGFTNVINHPPSAINTGGQKPRQPARNFPFLTPNNTVPTPITRR